jgi:hypothetical protein
MGCFSSMCKICNSPVNSTSFDGERVHILYMEEGVVKEEMTGKYDSYGCVFVDDTCTESVKWSNWEEMCNKSFDDNNQTGFVYMHTACEQAHPNYKPRTVSADDPNQGWGKLRPHLC